MHAHKLQVGATVYARVTADWHGVGCKLRNGAILEGHVLSVVPYAKPEKISEVGLTFNKAQCLGPEMGSFDLLLAAIEAPPRDLDLGVLTDPVPNPVPLAFGVPAPRDAGFKLIANSQSMHLDTRAGMDFNKSAYQFQNETMRIGEVSGFHGLKLSVGTGPDNSSLLSLKGHDLWLEKHTLLLLVPLQDTYARTLPEKGADQPAAPAVQPVEARASAAPPDAAVTAAATAIKPEEDADLCEPPQCNVALPAGDAIDMGKPEATFSIRQLGYSPRPQKMMRAFDNDEALAYLGPRELLVAFNPHILTSRHILGPSGSTVRLIRAVLLDTGTRQVTRTVDWELPDEGEYLWPLGDGTVLVHVASELRVYGNGLKVEKSIALDGPLAFVRVTPDGNFIAVGVVHERHTPELHARLAEILQGDPEEDVEVLVLNRNLDITNQSTERSGMMPPTLLNEGQARLVALSGVRYRISLLNWDNSSTTLAHFDSNCTPEFTSLAPDLIFLVSCETKSLAREYRVLHSNGKLALKGGSTLNDCGHDAEASANGETFAVRTVQSTTPLIPGGAFSAANLSSEDLAVYRAADGKRLLGVRVDAPSSSRNNYTLAQDGSHLAILAREHISIYSVTLK
jgi:hypothetical protein